MKNTLKKILSAALVVCVLIGLCACGKDSSTAGTGEAGEAAEITIAYQGGIGYAPVHVMEAKGLIQEKYKELNGGEVTVTFQKLDSGADINTGIIGGTIDIGCMGIAPAVSAVASGVPAKVISGLCSQSHGLMTSDPDIKSLADIGDTQIALVNIGSIQHILLAMACEKELGDAHALDNNIVKMSHAEGFAALEAGTYKLHLTSSPFILRERENDKFTEIKAVNEIWPDGNTFLVALASTELAENEDLFTAVTESFAEAIDTINTDPEGSAEIVAEYLGQDTETTLSDLQEETSSFFGELKASGQMAEFMYRAGFIDNEVTFEDFTFDNVTGD